MRLRFFSLIFAIMVSSATFASDPLVKVDGSPDTRPFVSSAVEFKRQEVLNIAVSMAHIDQNGADAFTRNLYDPNSSSFHQWIDTSEYGRRFGASDPDVKAISAYLASHGFTGINVSDNRLIISATGTQSAAESAFHSQFKNYVRPQNMVERGEPTTFFAMEEGPRLPASLAQLVSGVHGLSNFVIMHPMGLGAKKPMKKIALQAQVGYSPFDLANAYSTNVLHNAGLLGQGMKIAVISPTSRVLTDTAAFAQYYGITGYTVHDVKVGSGPPPLDGGADEAALDIETIIGQAPKSTLYLYEYDRSGSGELQAMNAIGAAKLPVVSSSWGAEEHAVIVGGGLSFATTFNNTIQSLAAAGISVFVASGDSGAFSRRTPPKVVTTGMETSSQYVTSVGGSRLYLNSNGTWKSEPLWSYDPGTNSGGGGGLSQIYARPVWQAGPGVITTRSNGKRQVPDISADADPYTGYWVYTRGQWAIIGGTSAATPLWASNVLLMVQEYRALTAVPTKSLGHLSPALYALGNLFENPAKDYSNFFYVYHDIVVGNNGLEATTPQWDFCSGWGSADFNKLIGDLGNYYKIPKFGPDFVPFNPHAVTGFAAWNKPLMIHISTTSVAEPAVYSHLNTLYFAGSVINQGNADGAPVTNALLIDGKVVAKFTYNALRPNGFNFTNNIYSTKLAAGTHSVQLVADYGNVLRELSLTNNLYTHPSIVVH